jgi:hypothetical protein
MIIEAILNVLVSLLLGVIGLFPSFPHIRFDFLDGVVRVLSLADTFVSLGVLSVCFAVVLVLQNAHVIWGVIMWVVRKIPGLE